MSFTKVKYEVKTDVWRKSVSEKNEFTNGQVMEFLKQTLTWLLLEVGWLVIALTFVSIEKRAPSISLRTFLFWLVIRITESNLF